MDKSDLDRIKELSGLADLVEGKQSGVKNPNVYKAYGVESFGDLYTKMLAELPGILKDTKGFYLDQDDKAMPIKLISKDGKSIWGLGARGGKLMILKDRGIFDIKDMKP